MYVEAKEGFSRHIRRWFESLVPTTPALREYVERSYSKACVWGPGSAVDDVETLLKKYRANDNAGAPGTSALLPIAIFTLSRDALPAVDWAGPGANPADVMLDGDAKQRVFRMQLAQNERRCQAVFIGPEEASAQSMAAQYGAFWRDINSRAFPCYYRFAGVDVEQYAMIETPDIFVNHVPNGQSNICILTADVNLRFTVPLLRAPKDTDPHDGRGTDGDPDDPHGFPVVSGLTITNEATPERITLTQDRMGDPIVESRELVLP